MVLTANCMQDMYVRFSLRSLQKIKNNRGPRQLPCGCHVLICVNLNMHRFHNHLLSILLSVSYHLDNFQTTGGLFHKYHIFPICPKGVSKAFDKSKNNEAVNFSFCWFLTMLLTNSPIACSQLCFALKPY